MRIIFMLFFAVVSLCVQAQSNIYQASSIPEELKKNANAVVRLDELSYKVSSMEKADQTHHLIATVLNKQGDDIAEIEEVYDNLITINRLDVTVYDKDGKKIKEYRKNHFNDQSLISNSSIFESTRMKNLDVKQLSYPYTVEITCSKSFNGFLSFPSWSPVNHYNLSVQQASYQLIVPPGYSVRTRETLLKAEVVRSDQFDKYLWSAENIVAYKREPLSVGLYDVTPSVLAAPDDFIYDGVKGYEKDWKTFGTWIYNLNKNLDVLPEKTKLKVQEIIQPHSEKLDKIKALYAYLQSTTRYVSVQLGIGGYRSFPAMQVASTNYGDCKALSNYMKALLKEAKIESNMVILGSGSNRLSLYPEYANFQQANHMILCVPDTKDTLWLECTSQTLPFGYIPQSNSDRTVLLIKESGGELVKIPAHSSADNLQVRKGKIKVSAEGKGEAEISTYFTNTQFEYNFSQLFKQPALQKEFLYNTLEIANPQIVKFNYVHANDSSSLKENLEINIDHIITFSGNNAFLTPNLLNRSRSMPEAAVDRKTDFSVAFGYQDEDVFEYQLPEVFNVQSIPQKTEIKTEFGNYSTEYKLINNVLIYTRKQTMYKNQYPPQKYDDFLKFYKEVAKADKQKILLDKKT